MGIKGLIRCPGALISMPSDEMLTMEKFRGQVVGVDAKSFLYKGAFEYATDFFTLPTTVDSEHIRSSMKRIGELFITEKITPILVFDGGMLEIKREETNTRMKDKRAHLARAMALRSKGLEKEGTERDDLTAKAHVQYQRAIYITPLIVNVFIKAMQVAHPDVKIIVAPYEADAQLAYMAINKDVQLVYTGDSDFIAFGCPEIIIEGDKAHPSFLYQASKLQMPLPNGNDFSGFEGEMLLEMCVLCGCDVFRMANMTSQNAYELIKEHKSYENVIKIKKGKERKLFEDSFEDFKRALVAFKHQLVYDIRQETVRPLKPTSQRLDQRCVGSFKSAEDQQKIARGEIDPDTLKPFEEDVVSVEQKVNYSSS